jgi:hypothetical protein
VQQPFTKTSELSNSPVSPSGHTVSALPPPSTVTVERNREPAGFRPRNQWRQRRHYLRETYFAAVDGLVGRPGCRVAHTTRAVLMGHRQRTVRSPTSRSQVAQFRICNVGEVLCDVRKRPAVRNEHEGSNEFDKLPVASLPFRSARLTIPR